MHAVAGDIIAVPGLHVGEAGRVGTVLEARGQDGSSSFRGRIYSWPAKEFGR